MAWKLVNPNITNDPSYLDPRLSDDESKISSNTTSLAEITSKTGWINPDSYTGLDYDKIQQAVVDALSTQKNIVLNRFYDITGHTIMVDIPLQQKPNRPYFIGLNGGFIKNDAGKMFDSTRIAFGMTFQNVTFKSVAGAGMTVFNGDYMFWVTTMNCRYINCDSVIKNFDTTAGYIQCFRSIGDIISGGSGYAFDIFGSYDSCLDNLSIEDRDGGFRHTKQGSNYVNVNLRIERSVFEGLNLVGIIIQDTHTCSIRNNFFEANLGGHMQLGSSSNYLRGLIVSENRAGDATSRSYPLITWSGNISGAISRNNSSSLINLHDATNVTTGWIDSKNDLIEGSATIIDPNNRIKIANNSVVFSTTADGGSKSVMYYDSFKKITYSKTLTLVAGVNTFDLGMDEAVSFDSVISVQFNATDVNLNSIYTVGAPKNNVRLRLNSTGSTTSLTVYLTILKTKYSTTG